MKTLTSPDGPVLVQPSSVIRLEAYEDGWVRVTLSDGDSVREELGL